jgi:hypothetical protein
VPIVLRDGPELLRKHRIEFLILDECCDAGSPLARTLRIPFVSLALALTRFEELGVPHWGCRLPYSDDPAIVAQYVPWSKAISAAGAPLLEPINQERARFGLSPVKHVMETHSELAAISQQPANLIFQGASYLRHFITQVLLLIQRLDQRLLFPGSNSMDVRSSMRAWAHCRTGCPLYFVSLRRHVRHWVSSWCWA